MIRIRKLISKTTVVKLYKAFILPHFHQCSVQYEISSVFVPH